ncbi:hypothetical protein [Spiroplasma citri]|uniref:hypothetical protein n=1 Tax=Spiroplasma citri TaxID=2133 RepID=UPI00090CC109|nr:hypothetical protein [Spiroplasma citri]APE75175.1 hypothetical protein SCITRI_001298 [Spiroplasma citri]
MPLFKKRLEKGLKDDKTLGELGENITYASEKNLNFIKFNPDTNGVTPVLPYDKKYVLKLILVMRQTS